MNNRNMPNEIKEVLKDFFSVQLREIELKKEELSIRKDELSINKEIALSTIESQKEIEIKRGDVFLNHQNGKLRFWGISSVIFAAIISFAMYLDKSNIAIRIIEISGSVLLGYFAGVNHGKSKILEQQNRQQTEE